MRIVIDLQAAQAENRNRGIGRYSLSLALAIARNKGDHEVLIALNGAFPESIENIKKVFIGILPDNAFWVWEELNNVSGIDERHNWRRESAELIREAFLSNLNPDVILISSFFEGLVDNAVTNINIYEKNYATFVVLYDLIPLIHQKPYLDNPSVKNWYLNKIENLCLADTLLSISESSRKEGIKYLNKPASDVINISTDADEQFKIIEVSSEFETLIRDKYDLSRNFVMYTGGIDHRKNIEGLICAYAQLSQVIRGSHQLAIVCSYDEVSRARLEALAYQYGLRRGELVFTGYVPEAELVALYNICKLFVFPSWHEGFGLPALEAMRCGAAVIAANSTSLPEVVGWTGALFDPHSDIAIKNSIEAALTDKDFYCALKENAKNQSKIFCWDQSGLAAIRAMERVVKSNKKILPIQLDNKQRKKLAYISPLPPSKTGIADYSSELLPFLSKYYEIDVVVPKGMCSDKWVEKNCSIRAIEWFRENSAEYERVLYHFGNSEFHSHMFDLLRSIPGVVVLHDFYLSGILAHMDVHGFNPGAWARELYHSHGYHAFVHRFRAKDTADVVWKYPVSLGVIQDSVGIIVHSNNSLELSRDWYILDSNNGWKVIPHMRNSAIAGSKIDARRNLKLQQKNFVVCSFGLLGPHKLNQKLLDAFLKSSLAKDKNCILVFVGENNPSEYGNLLESSIEKSGFGDKIRITGWTDSKEFKLYLSAADIAVQLRTLSRGETSGTVLDCMNHGIPTIINANGSMSDISNDSVYKLPDEFIENDLIEALESLYINEQLRRSIGRNARETILDAHDPLKCAKLYELAIEDFYAKFKATPLALARNIGNKTANDLDDDELMDVAKVLSRNFPPRNRVPQILVDISELIKIDSRTGIQRVVRSILTEWLENKSTEYRIEPIYANTEQIGYKYARQYISKFLKCPNNLLIDEDIEYAKGDIFIGLDLQQLVVCAQETFYNSMRMHGVSVNFVVYDLLPILLPHAFIPIAKEMHENWLRVITQGNRALCISDTVANDLTEWLATNHPERMKNLSIASFELGSDLENSVITTGIPPQGESLLKTLSNGVSFLMVGTIEPRKGHADILDIFDILWKSNQDLNLVIVGKQGWEVEKLIERIKSHEKFGRGLYWLNEISDEYLIKLYEIGTCLILASHGEGYGLPIIEAAKYKMPIIARDITVFREVAKDGAYFFDSTDPENVANEIEKWLQLFSVGKHPRSEIVPKKSWKESADFLKILLI